MSSRLTVVLVSLLLATLTLIFWLWLVILPAREAILCPERCRYHPEGYHVACSSVSLNSIPLILPKNVHNFVLGSSSLTSLSKDRFVSSWLNELEEISIKDCEIGTIKLRAFSGLWKLALLSTCGSRVREITAHV